jgi:DNA-binding transcriptional ArsR family regulator
MSSNLRIGTTKHYFPMKIRLGRRKLRNKAERIDIFDLIGKSENIERASEAMRAMAHPMRLKILCMLGNGELSVQEIVDGVGTTQSNISQHLSILKTHAIIAARKEANKVFYRIEDARILKMITLTRDIFCSV